MSTVVISDIHIGTNEVTNWYQTSVHEPYFLKMVNWIINKKDTLGLNRFLILGDLFDYWTYPPEMQPPSTQAILAKNPGLFGPGGAFSRIFAAFGSEVYYIRGNHDINVTQADLDLITDGIHKVTLLPDVYTDPSLLTLFTHGHLYTMFNAPDNRPNVKIPVGHFVTRAVAHAVKNKLQPGQTVADLGDWGVPGQFTAAVSTAVQSLGIGITAFMLETISHSTGLDRNTPIILPDGSTMTINQAIPLYDPLYQTWVDSYGGGEYGTQVAKKAMIADYDGHYLAWFAQRDALRNGMAGAVTGHTHIPKLQIEEGAIKYVNTGFECAPVPHLQNNKAQFTFAVISKPEADHHPTMTMYRVEKEGSNSYDVKETEAPKDKVVFYGSVDFSCYVRIDNDTDQPMVLMPTQDAPKGYYVVDPPQTIPPHSSAWIWLQDLPGIFKGGTKGHVAYNLADLRFECPEVGSNSASGAPLSAKSGDGEWKDNVPSGGHPFFVKFRVS